MIIQPNLPTNNAIRDAQGNRDNRNDDPDDVDDMVDGCVLVGWVVACRV
jgi:hypothetical protein